MKKITTLSLFFCLFFGGANALKAQATDTLIVTMKLGAVNGFLIYNGTQTPQDELEMLWGVRIDSDDDITTGMDGFDLEISLTHFKGAGGMKLGSIVQATKGAVWRLSDAGRTKLDTTFSATLNNADTTLTIKVLKGHAEVAQVTGGNRYIGLTVNRETTGYAGDTTDVGEIPDMISDPRGDGSTDMHDIIYVELREVKKPASIKTVLNKNVSLKLYPQPMQTSAIIEISGEISQAMDLKIYNAQGKMVGSVNQVKENIIKIERNNLPAGMYFYNLSTANNIIANGKIVIAD